MAAIKTMAAITEKWVRVTPARVEDYTKGIQSPRKDWATETAAASANWKAGVDAAHTKGLFARGVTEAGTPKWKSRTLAKGPGRFAEGVIIAGPDYEKGFSPYRTAIAALDLGPKYPRRDPRNLGRVKLVVDAMIKVKMGA